MIKITHYARGQQLAGGPERIKTDRYDIIAKAKNRSGTGDHGEPSKSLHEVCGAEPAAAARTVEGSFRAAAPSGDARRAIFPLRVAKSGSKMEALGDRDGDPLAIMGIGHLAMIGDKKGPVSELMDILERPVVDETGLTGDYKNNLEWTLDTARPPDNPGAGDTPEGGGASLFWAVKEQLGSSWRRKKVRYRC